MTLLAGECGVYSNKVYLVTLVCFDMPSKTAIVFIDGNNWYHNSKCFLSKPADIDFNKLANFICTHFELNLVEIVYYNSVPDIRDGEAMYYRHLMYLSDLEKQGIKVKTRKLQTTSTKELKAERTILIDSLDLSIMLRYNRTTLHQSFPDKI